MEFVSTTETWIEDEGTLISSKGNRAYEATLLRVPRPMNYVSVGAIW